LPLSATGEADVRAVGEAVAVGDSFAEVVDVALGDATAAPDSACPVVVVCAGAVVAVGVVSLSLLDPTLHATVPILKSPRTDSTVNEKRSCWR
jgi:hypothetical protein